MSDKEKPYRTGEMPDNLISLDWSRFLATVEALERAEDGCRDTTWQNHADHWRKRAEKAEAAAADALRRARRAEAALMKREGELARLLSWHERFRVIFEESLKTQNAGPLIHFRFETPMPEAMPTADELDKARVVGLSGWASPEQCLDLANLAWRHGFAFALGRTRVLGERRGDKP